MAPVNPELSNNFTFFILLFIHSFLLYLFPFWSLLCLFGFQFRGPIFYSSSAVSILYKKKKDNIEGIFQNGVYGANARFLRSGTWKETHCWNHWQAPDYCWRRSIFYRIWDPTVRITAESCTSAVETLLRLSCRYVQSSTSEGWNPPCGPHDSIVCIFTRGFKMRKQKHSVNTKQQNLCLVFVSDLPDQESHQNPQAKDFKIQLADS